MKKSLFGMACLALPKMYKKDIFILSFALLIYSFFLIDLAYSKNNPNQLKIGVVFNEGSIADKSFGESAYRGFERFKKDFDNPYRYHQVSTKAQAELAIRKLAGLSDIVFVISYNYLTPLKNVAPEFPDTNFVIIDEILDMPNVKCLTFKEHEGAFIAGALAALYTQTDKIGFIGGMDVPLIRKFEYAYIEGAKHIKPQIKIFKNTVGSTDFAWRDPARGNELAQSQIDRGADVIFAAAGGTGIGVYQAAADHGVYAIGVDSNQNYIQPGHMLTSIIKSLDTIIYNILVETRNDKFKATTTKLGLLEGGIDYTIDQYNQPLLSKEEKMILNSAKENIMNAKIYVPNYIEINKEKRLN